MVQTISDSPHNDQRGLKHWSCCCWAASCWQHLVRGYQGGSGTVPLVGRGTRRRRFGIGPWPGGSAVWMRFTLSTVPDGYFVESYYSPVSVDGTAQIDGARHPCAQRTEGWLQGHEAQMRPFSRGLRSNLGRFYQPTAAATRRSVEALSVAERVASPPPRAVEVAG